MSQPPTQVLDGSLDLSTETSRKHRRLMAIAESAFLLLAATSLVYSAVTALREGRDLAMFQDMGRAWVAGVYQTSEGPFYGPPPFASVLFSSFALLSFAQLRAIFVLFNLLATGAILLLVKRLWGAAWPARARMNLAAFVLCWASFRVTVRYGQISLIVTALVLAALLAWKRRSNVLAGLLLGVSLCKYPLTLPFALYFLWRREWKVVATAVLAVAALTGAYAIKLGLSPIAVTSDYVWALLHTSISNQARFNGVTDIGPILSALTGSRWLGRGLNIALALFGITAMATIFRRRPSCEKMHLTIVSLFSLWFVYHRIYDAVICVIPAAVFLDLIVRGKVRKPGFIGVAALGLLGASVSGILTERLHLGSESLAANPVGFVGLHFDRILVFGLFWSLIMFLWKLPPGDLEEPGTVAATVS
ncbi:MAG TPA: glycosyltransferase family 87 protein [Blastocatellia bacterium]|nr:glycosyltransferase family 87 protein [Blastocatellia bacterium]